MRHTFIAAAFAVASVVGLGCANKDEASAGKGKMSADACAMCAGHQTATASNTCPSCNMSVEKMHHGAMKHDANHGAMKHDAMPGSPTTRATVDACTKCPGTQTLTANNVCPMCAGKPM